MSYARDQLPLHISKVNELQLFEEVKTIAEEVFGRFIIVNPFFNPQQFNEWKEEQTRLNVELPIWLRNINNYKEFDFYARSYGGIIAQMIIDGVYNEIKEAYNPEKS